MDYKGGIKILLNNTLIGFIINIRMEVSQYLKNAEESQD